MTTVVLVVIAVWLVLCALATVACTLIARGGRDEDERRGYLDADLARLLEDEAAGRPRAVPQPGASTG